MKFFLITLLIIFAFIFSCKKTKDDIQHIEPDIYYGYCDVKKNGVEWDAKSQGIYDTIRWKRDAITIYAGHFENDILKESIYFSRVPLKKGNYTLSRYANGDEEQKNIGAVHYIEFENGHAGGVIFDLDTLSKSNTFEVLNYDTNSGEIKVKFSATFFIRDRDKAHIIDTVKFTNGEILTKAFN